ncbi:hypothetical protein MKX01_015388 [Papaver californicum]|nr:hypothetical protein MKX01_015388 [Papaver californicum]
MLKVTVRESSIVKPAGETPKVCLWTSNIDQLPPIHVQTVYFYRHPALADGFSPSSSCYGDFFNSTLLKDGLSKALVTYYPIAGRLKRNESGRAEIDCTGEGMIFIDAETDSLINDLGKFIPNEQLMNLSPNLGNNKDISLYPPLLVQVTHFKCGGVCLSTSLSHIIVDGVCGVNFLIAWSNLCRGVGGIKSVPFFDRTVLRARDPPIVSFPHIEYNKPTSMNIPSTLPSTKPKIAIAKLGISTMQVNRLKSKCNKGEFRFSTYEVIAGHIWRCSCKARELKDDQETVISIPLDCRLRSSPPLPDGYFGNAIFDLAPDNKDVRKTMNISILERGPQSCNIRNISWLRLPIYEADFGWGQPHYMRLGTVGLAGLSLLAPKNPPGSEGGFSLTISLQSNYHMNLFKHYFYDI